jgi:hypothetical protein
MPGAAARRPARQSGRSKHRNPSPSTARPRPVVQDVVDEVDSHRLWPREGFRGPRRGHPELAGRIGQGRPALPSEVRGEALLSLSRARTRLRRETLGLSSGRRLSRTLSRPRSAVRGGDGRVGPCLPCQAQAGLGQRGDPAVTGHHYDGVREIVRERSRGRTAYGRFETRSGIAVGRRNFS